MIDIPPVNWGFYNSYKPCWSGAVLFQHLGIQPRVKSGFSVRIVIKNCHCRAWPGNPTTGAFFLLSKTPVPAERSRFLFCCCFPNHRKNFLPEHKASRRSDCLFPKTTTFRHGLKVQRRRLCRLRPARMTGYCKC